MKFRFLLLLSFACVLLTGMVRSGLANTDCGGPAPTTTPTNAGTTFLLCFEENTDPHLIRSKDEGYLGIYLASTGDTATVTITTNLYPNYQKTIFLKANADTSYDISDDTVSTPGGMRNLWEVSDEFADNAVVIVQSTAPVVCYGLDYKPFSADAFCALPIDYAGTEYRILSYPSATLSVEGYAASSEFVVAAYYDNTTVTITPSVRTVHGSQPNVPEKFTLNRGECIQVQADTPNSVNSFVNLDLTGSMVTANHPVTVYSGNVRTPVPYTGWVRFPDQYVDRDMMLEAMPPTSAWGNTFVLGPIEPDKMSIFGSDSDIVRILALNDSTHVSLDGVPLTILKANQDTDLTITAVMLITSDAPLLVAEMEHSEFAYGGNGDPFLAIVPPMEQTYNNYTFVLPMDTNFRYQSVIIAADTNSVGDISIDGTTIPSINYIPVPGSANGRAFALCYCSLQQGEHIIRSHEQVSQGFTILAYGDGAAVSYGYAAGSLLVPKRSIMISDPPQTIGENSTNTLLYRNTAYQAAYLDSALFVPYDRKDTAFGVHVAEDIAMDVGRMDIGQSNEIHLVSNTFLTKSVSGSVKIYSHLPSYFDIDPGTIPFTLYPIDASAVEQSEINSLKASVNPDPLITTATLQFTLSIAGTTKIVIYDQLGREIREVANTVFSSGSHSVRIDRMGLASGFYLCEISLNGAEPRERIPIIVAE